MFFLFQVQVVLCFSPLNTTQWCVVWHSFFSLFVLNLCVFSTGTVPVTHIFFTWHRKNTRFLIYSTRWQRLSCWQLWKIFWQFSFLPVPSLIHVQSGMGVSVCYGTGRSVSLFIFCKYELGLRKQSIWVKEKNDLFSYSQMHFQIPHNQTLLGVYALVRVHQLEWADVNGVPAVAEGYAPFRIIAVLTQTLAEGEA